MRSLLTTRKGTPMRKSVIALLAILALVLGASVAMADPGKGRNNPKPENPPCDADHGHPGDNASNKPGKGPKCDPPDTECPEGEIEDSVTGECVPECPDGSAPADGECPADPECPEGEIEDSVTGECVPECPDGSAPADGECPADPECPEGEIEDSVTGECVPECPDGSAPADGECPNGEPVECRARVLNLFDEALVLFEANADGTPCVTEDGSLLNAGQLRIARATTDADDNNRSVAEVLGLGGTEGDPGGISLLGATADCDGQDAWILLIHQGEDEALRIGDGGDIEIPDLELAPGTGLYFTETGGGKAQALALLIGDTEILVVSEAEASC
jgi:hypothetical protein